MSEPVTDEDLHIVWLDAAKRTRQQTEREIVAWLRAGGLWIKPMPDNFEREYSSLADEIERGEYRK